MWSRLAGAGDEARSAMSNCSPWPWRRCTGDRHTPLDAVRLLPARAMYPAFSVTRNAVSHGPMYVVQAACARWRGRC